MQHGKDVSMRKNQTSITAAGIAVMRAVESEKPEDERICYDPYARKFIPACAMLPETSMWGKILPWNRTNMTSNVLKGVAGSTGKVTGTARVLFGPEDFGKMKLGDVLVAVTTTPAWTPLFALASAIVTDIGGPLSHSSIVAREYGIPAVLSTGMATRRIMNGQTIIVDGGRGTVELL
jgi:phosphoenolpyruvate synthase/pyruvate phosphate dikinase